MPCFLVALRGKRGGNALKHTRDLVKKRSGTIFRVLLTIGIANTPVTKVLWKLMYPQVFVTDGNGIILTIISYLIRAFHLTINAGFLNIYDSHDLQKSNINSKQCARGARTIVDTKNINKSDRTEEGGCDRFHFNRFANIISIASVLKKRA